MPRAMEPTEHSTRAPDPPTAAIGAVLARAVGAPAGAAVPLQAPPALESWPGVVHGGAVAALLDLLAGDAGAPRGPRAMEARLTTAVPTTTALTVERRAAPGAVALTIARAGSLLVSATVSAGWTPATPAWPGGDGGLALPTSERCLACGEANPVGLRVRLRFDGCGVWATLDPPPTWLEAGRPHAALAPVLLDEVAWWLGALTMGEGGVTNRLALGLAAEDAPVSGPLVAAGRLAEVAPIDRRRTFWRTTVALADRTGAVLAAGTVVFRGGVEYSGAQLGYFRARTPPATFARMFPRYAG